MAAARADESVPGVLRPTSWPSFCLRYLPRAPRPARRGRRCCTGRRRRTRASRRSGKSSTRRPARPGAGSTPRRGSAPRGGGSRRAGCSCRRWRSRRGSIRSYRRPAPRRAASRISGSARRKFASLSPRTHLSTTPATRTVGGGPSPSAPFWAGPAAESGPAGRCRRGPAIESWTTSPMDLGDGSGCCVVIIARERACATAVPAVWDGPTRPGRPWHTDMDKPPAA